MSAVRFLFLCSFHCKMLSRHDCLIYILGRALLWFSEDTLLIHCLVLYFFLIKGFKSSLISLFMYWMGIQRDNVSIISALLLALDLTQCLLRFEIEKCVLMSIKHGVLMVQRLKHCTPDFQVVGLKPAHARVSGMYFPRELPLGHISQMRPVRRVNNQTRLGSCLLKS